MDTKKNNFTVKITLSYLLLVLLAIIASYYIYNEVNAYIATETTTEKDNKLLRTNSFLAQLYEAESLSKLAIQTRSKSNFTAYQNKIDSIYTDIEALKLLTENTYQKGLLDSLHSLLRKKATNINALRTLKINDQTSSAIDFALKEFDKLEESLGIIKPESLAPNIDELSPKAQSAIKKVADYLNANIPQEENPQLKAQRMDSVLTISKNLLKDVQQENNNTENSLAMRENSINKTDMELTQQLRSILSSFEHEITMNSLANSIKKETLLNRSIKLAVIAAILGFLVVGVFIFILNRDFWKVNLLREKLEKEKQLSESLLKSREQLIATVSHDLRTPLNTISGYTQLIETSKTIDKEHLNHIKSATGYVNNLVNDLLDFSQLEAGKMVAKNNTFLVDQLLRESATNIATQYSQKNIDLILNLDTSLAKPIVLDDFRLRQILSNLLGNAFKFTEQGKITLSAFIKQVRNEPVLYIIIEDTGIGISKEQQKLIFKEFTQAGTTTNKKHEGYGLGLTITKKLTELLNGKIILESEIGSGSKFTLKIPTQFGVLNTVPQSGSNKKKRINSALVIDDDPSFLQLIGEMMKSAHINTRLYTNFNTYDTAVNFHYDVVLTDIEMPNATGYDVVTKLRSPLFPNHTDQPIIAMTGRNDLSVEHFRNKGFDELLRKPFSKTELLQKLKLFGPITFTEKVNTTAPIQTKVKEGPFTFDTLKMFIGNDEAALNEILSTFLKDTEENAKNLTAAVDALNITEINKTAHKMLPMFRQLNAKKVVDVLEQFERLKRKELTAQQIKEKHLAVKQNINVIIKAISV
ncbi:Response regulator receiver domain-containing protein [Maribacter sedimenticola]|uniref:histidine kinase n=1 Tax=Maribacter sedimenticola TaxID=228956 RepID=A0ABY1SI25_9FLAO|nr:ATP-binding protein [Maribacter sedimenticola]SNR56378.1 Response regulator receiver domain-containing protein [Maribacter sedimenticola]